MPGLSQEGTQRLCKSFAIETFKKDDIIIRERHYHNNKFYVMLSGKVGVFVKHINRLKKLA